MYSVLSIGKTGLKSMQNKMDSVAGDLANVNTTGYKRKEISFQELLVNEISDSDVLQSLNVNNASINVGSKSGVVSTQFEQGVIVPSDGDFHMAIEGEGFFGVRDENGSLLLTRNGGFHINENNTIVDNSGYSLDVDLNLPLDQWEPIGISISSIGEITAKIDGQTTNLGKVVLYRPQVLDSLTSLGENRYMPSQNVPLYNSINQEEGFGEIIQYSLEESNVELGKTMADMITTQRAYSLNAKTIQTTNDMMTMINNLKR